MFWLHTFVSLDTFSYVGETKKETDFFCHSYSVATCQDWLCGFVFLSAIVLYWQLQMLSNLVAQQGGWLLISCLFSWVPPLLREMFCQLIIHHQISNNRNLVSDHVRFSAIPDICYCVFHNKQANKTVIHIKKDSGKIQFHLNIITD